MGSFFLFSVLVLPKANNLSESKHMQCQLICYNFIACTSGINTSCLRMLKKSQLPLITGVIKNLGHPKKIIMIIVWPTCHVTYSGVVTCVDITDYV